MRILIVDDNRDSAESLAIFLRFDAHEVATAFDGDSVAAEAQAFQPDVIILDIGLPGIDGYEVARRLRRAGCTARLIAMTGYGQPEDRVRTKEAGFDDHLVKPVDPLSLAPLLKKPPG
jgi:DNA-binding response OmpR family regulator